MKYITTSESHFSEFRLWLASQWAVHCNEVLSATHKAVNYPMETWIKKNKHFLRRRYSDIILEEKTK
jgi:hypothetical protein